jgi:hypothetical protein
MINNMDMVKNFGLMELVLKGIILMGRRMAKEYTRLQLVPNIRGILLIILSMVLENTLGLMGTVIRVIGRIIK